MTVFTLKITNQIGPTIEKSFKTISRYTVSIRRQRLDDYLVETISSLSA